MDATTYALRFQKLINKKTISSSRDEKEFEAFYQELKNLFPLIYEKCETHFFKEGGIYYIYKGKRHDHPILLMHHHDVVKVDDSWTKDPFKGEIINGVIYGRGTLDTKGGLFCMLSAVEELLENNFVPEQDVYLLSTANEEINGQGADYISKYFLQQGIKFHFVLDEGGMILHDPIGFADGDFAMIGVGEKPCADFKFTAKSAAGHASTPGRKTPLVTLAKFILTVNKSHKFTKKISKTTKQTFKNFASKMHGPLKIVFKHPTLFAPLFKTVISKTSPSMNALLRTTTAFTMASGANAVNILPNEASVVINVRIAHHQGIDKVYKIMKHYADKFDLEMEIIDTPFDSKVTSYKNDGFKILSEAIKTKFPDAIPNPYIANTGSDSRYMNRCAEQIYCFAPFFISKEQFESIHGKDESLDIINLPKAINVFRTLIKSKW